MKYAVIPVTPLEQNASLIWCEETMKGAAIDPGGNLERILGAASDHGVELEKILVTHGHIDHAGGVAELAGKLNLPIEGPHRGDDYWIDGIPAIAASYGMPDARSFTPSRWLEGGDSVRVGNATLSVHHCPGHTPGHVVFYHAGDKAEDKVAFVGDVLFHGSIGRTDFPGGDYETLLRSIREELWPLGDDVTFVPGHGHRSTFGEEKRTNPFVGERAMNQPQ